MPPEQRRLRKADVEALLTDFDTDPVVALSRALRLLTDLPDETPWDELIHHSGLAAERRAALLDLDTQALDELAAELNERRRIADD